MMAQQRKMTVNLLLKISKKNTNTSDDKKIKTKREMGEKCQVESIIG